VSSRGRVHLYRPSKNLQKATLLLAGSGHPDLPCGAAAFRFNISYKFGFPGFSSFAFIFRFFEISAIFLRAVFLERGRRFRENSGSDA
jgi:hypothetical protein